MRNAGLISTLLLTCCYCLGTLVQPRLAYLPIYEHQENGPLEALMGDGRKLFANYFFVKADVYFHSGFYPTIFDNRESFQSAHVAADAGAIEEKNTGGEAEFLGPPRDWLDRFSRSFFPSKHTHLGEEGAHGEEGTGNLGGSAEVREILPWLKMSAELDPQRVETYTAGAYWLRNRMGKVDEAEEFLREGLRANPGDPAILFELGRIYQENRHDPDRARNIWEAALRRWRETEGKKKDPDRFFLLQLAWHLARLEEGEKHFAKAVAYLEIAKSASPNPDQVQAWIDQIKVRESGK